ncbi:lipase family protein [Chitinophaga silvatica]|uniref:Lipase family protein n=1 Tax=Chitinophaga silvatica TaxID=2282649 RepID=A0A3E1Y8R5_9BACT|nr:lipase family protein [Chitinophaga silvatica]RFS21802.1 lipase family protein [Chitinophaga silvatica]
MEKMILHMWDASSLAGAINNGTIDANKHSISNSSTIKTIYSNLKVYSQNVNLGHPNFPVSHTGFVATAETEAGQIPVISFKGTDGGVDGLNNLQANWTKFLDGTDVHTAFYQAANAFYPDIVRDEIVKDALNNNKPIYLTGHSKGGAIATLIARMITINKPGKKLKVFTFGSPRVGSSQFALKYEDKNEIDHLRVESCGDLIPHLPLYKDEYKLPNSYLDFIPKILIPSSLYEYASVGKYQPVNYDSNYIYNVEGIKPAQSKIGTSKNDLNAFYSALKSLIKDNGKNIFGDKHGKYFPSYNTNRSVRLR